ncbi:MAG TPA: GNAT family N-acetyltransferase [Thermoplasmata archaeon]|nr:GNAT family N-acetyltransferase [Thermoplasmata archaeon]
MNEALRVASLPEGVEGPAFLRTGEIVDIRVLRPSDLPVVERFLREVSDESRATRFFGAVRSDVVADRMLRAGERDDRLQLVVTPVGRPDGPILAHAEYVRDAPGAAGAEVAFLVADALHGRGIATILLMRLVRAATPIGVETFHAQVLADNDRMLEVFRDSGFPTTSTFTDEGISVSLRIDRPPLTELCLLPTAPAPA